MCGYVMDDEHPSNFQLAKYAILYILSESNEGKTCDELIELVGIPANYVIPSLNKLIGWNEVERNKTNPNITYTIKPRGRKKLEFFKKTKNYDKHWQPPWERV